jgi:hypothetical protein
MNKRPYLIVFIILAFTVSSCALSRFTHLRTESIRDEQTITGSYDLILYGNRYGNDLETVAVLDIADDEYTFEPYAPSYDYRISKDIESDKAISEALSFVSKHTAFRTALIKRITLDGETLGYEVKPLYLRHRYGQASIKRVYYTLKDKKVFMYVRVKNYVEKMLDRGVSE